MTTTQSQQTHCPQALAASLIAIPILYFGLLALVGPVSHFAIHLILAWTAAVIASAAAFGFDRRFARQFSTAERLGILAGNGLTALMMGTLGGMMSFSII